MSIDQNAMIQSIAAKAMGLPTEAAPPAAEPAPAEAPPAADPRVAAKVDPKEKDTAKDKAIAAGSPTDGATEDAILYEIEFGEGQKRKLTPQQIASTMKRYSELNYKNAQFKPVIELVERMLEANPGSKAEDAAKFIMSAIKAGQTNATMGDKTKKSETPPPDDDGDDPFDKWEKENAVTLPPGFRDMSKTNQALMDEIGQLKQMLAQVISGTQGVADAARAGHQDARTQQVDAIRQTIANNLDGVQSHLGLPDDAAEDFMTFAAERGYTMEDFIDPRLTLSVMTDFKNNLNSPEMDRLRQIAQRRQAFTGTMGGSAPASGAPTTAPADGGDPTFNKTLEYAMAKRGIGQG